MNENKIEKLLDLAEEFARTILIEQHQQELMPSWVLVDDDDKAMIIGTPWTSTTNKYKVERRLRRFMRQHRITAYSFVGEAWSSGPVSNPESALPPRLDPNRREVVIAIANDGTQKGARQWKIIRDWNERVIRLELESDLPMQSGWITDLL